MNGQNNNLNPNHCVKRFSDMFNFVTSSIFSLFNHFTKINSELDKRVFIKINSEDYDRIKEYRHIRYTLSKLQNILLYHNKKCDASNRTNLSYKDIERHLHNPK